MALTYCLASFHFNLKDPFSISWRAVLAVMNSLNFLFILECLNCSLMCEEKLRRKKSVLQNGEFFVDSFFFQHFKYVVPLPSGSHGFWLEINLLILLSILVFCFSLATFKIWSLFLQIFFIFFSSWNSHSVYVGPLGLCLRRPLGSVHFSSFSFLSSPSDWMISNVLSSSSLFVLYAKLCC